jgi:signal peptidase I
MKKETRKEIVSWIIYFVVLAAILLGVRTFFTMATVSGHSMDPNLYNNEKMLVFRKAQIKRNSVIVFDANGEDPTVTSTKYYVKRVIGVPGDQVAYQNGKLYVNHKVVNQSFISKDELTNGTKYMVDADHQLDHWDLSSLSKSKWGYANTAKVVPKGKYFVLGDNRAISNDSRYWGFVDENKVLGVAKIFPWSGTKTERHNVNDLAS